MSQIKLAEAQLIGFSLASKGHPIKMVAEGMGLTKLEWLRIRQYVDLKPLDKADLDEKYGVSE